MRSATGGGSELLTNVSNTYSVTVEATDSNQEDGDRKLVTVTVTNEDEPDGTVKLTTLSADGWGPTDSQRYRS